jgi:glycosyltransferase involved in cell wall biosynthesis
MYSLALRRDWPLRGDEGLLLHYPHYNLPLTHRGPAVVNVFDLAHWRLPEKLRQKIYCGTHLYRLHRKKNALIVAPSNFIADEIHAWGFSARQLEVVPLAPHPDFRRVFETRMKDERKSAGQGLQRANSSSPMSQTNLFNINEPDAEATGQKANTGSQDAEDSKPDTLPPSPWFLTIGIHKAHKNFEGVLRVFDYLWDRKKFEPGLVMAGLRPADKAALEKLRRRIRHPEKLTLVLQTTRPRLIEMYQSATALVFPSLYEGFGLPVLEAMACGTPVISSLAPPMDELFGDAVLGFAPDDAGGLAEALRTVSRDDSARRDLIMRGNAACQRYNPEVFARTMRDVYEKAGGL